MTGCKPQKQDEPAFVEASISPLEIVSINIYNDEFYGSDPKMHEDERQEFIKYIKETFGIELTVEGIGQPNRMRDVFEATEGFVQLVSVALDNYAESGLIYPLTEILAANETWNSLPQYYKDNAMLGGEIWGIPARTQMDMVFNGRFIRKDWLAGSGLDVPDSLDEYYECMKQFTYGDPDNNKLNDTTGFTSYGLSGLTDIFNSFNCRISQTNTYRLAWDPINNMFVDGLQSKHAYDCLSYLSSCYSEKLLAQNFHSIGRVGITDEYTKGKIGSISTPITYHDDFEDRLGTEHEIIIGLEGNNKKGIVPIQYYCSEFYVLTVQTDNKELIVNKFVDTFLGSETGYFSGMYGLPDTESKVNAFYLDGEKIVLNFEIKDGRLAKTYTPGIINGHPVYSKYEVVYQNCEEGEYPWNVISQYDRELPKTLYKEFSEMFFTVTNKNSHGFYRGYSIGPDVNREEISKLGTKVILDSIRGKVDINDALDEYREAVNIMGLNDLLDKVNTDVLNGVY